MSSTTEISIVIPVYNSATILNELVERITKAVNQTHEIILVDDGSKDNSWNTIVKLK